MVGRPERGPSVIICKASLLTRDEVLQGKDIIELMPSEHELKSPKLSEQAANFVSKIKAAQAPEPGKVGKPKLGGPVNPEP